MKRLFALIVLTALCIAMAACGNEQKKDSGYSEDDARHDRAALEEYLAGPDGQKMIDDYTAGNADSMFIADCSAEDGYLIFSQKAKTQLDDDTFQKIRPDIEEYLNDFHFSTVADTLKNDASIIGPKIKVVFYNADGSVIANATVTYVEGIYSETHVSDKLSSKKTF